VTSALSRFAFIDAVHAAEVLHTTQDQILDWVKSGKLKAYGGKPANPFLRSADVATLVEELGVAADEPPRRTKSASARVQPRLTSDSRWSGVSEEDIREWVTRADPTRRQAARTAAGTARERLAMVLAILDELDR